MSVLGFAGAELGTTGELTSVSGISMETSLVHGGKYSYRVSNGGIGYLAFAAHSTPIYFRGYFYLPAGHTTYSNILNFNDATNTAILSVFALGPDGAPPQIIQANTATQAFQGATVIRESVWHRLEVLLHQAAGICEVRVNGRREILTTVAVFAATVTSISIISSTPATGNVLWDDLHVTEDGWPGPGYVLARQGRPGTPTYNDFVKTGGGGLIDVIWSDTPANATTLANTTLPSQNQTMLVEASSGPPIAAKYGAQFIAPRDTVYGAKVYAFGHRVGGPGGSADHYVIRSLLGTITRTGPFNFTTLDTIRSTEIFPATLAQLDALEIGVARGASTAVIDLFITDVWLMVSYLPAPVPMRHFTGFETGSLTEVPGVTGTVTIDTAQVRSGVYAIKCLQAGSYFLLYPDPIEAPMMWVRVYVYLPSLPSPAQTVMAMADPLLVQYQLTVDILPDGKGRLTVGATSATTVTPVFVTGAWNYIEVVKRASVIPGDGYAAAWINNQQLTIPLAETGGAMTNTFCSGILSGTLPLWFDDLAVSETGRIGPGRVLARQGQPGTPAQSAWTKVGGLIEVVWSNTPSNPATYAQGPGNQLMLVNPQANGGAFIGPTDLITACRVVAMARYDTGASSSTPTQLRYRIIRPGLGALTKDTSVVITSTTARLVYSDIFAAVLEYLKTIEIGGRQVAGTGSVLRIDDIWLMVAYSDLQILDLPVSSTPAPVALVEIAL